MRDIDEIIAQIRTLIPTVEIRQLQVSHPGDDDGLWFFDQPDGECQVQIESSTGMCPFLIETDENGAGITTKSVDETVQVLVRLLRQREGHWWLIGPICDVVNIYDGAEVFLDSYSKAGPAAGHLYAAHFCQYEVCNGGFEQFFSNSTGVLAPEAVEGFRAIGQQKIADLIEQAMLPFGQEYLRDRERRHVVLGGLPRRAFYSLDRQFFALIHTEAGGFEEAAGRYAARFRKKS